jgi:hypothetical protein
MPSDTNSLPGLQVNSIISLRLILLSDTRTHKEEALVHRISEFYQNYFYLGRSEHDIVAMVTRDFALLYQGSLV